MKHFLKKMIQINKIETKPFVELLKESNLFDESFYLDQYPDVKNADMVAIEHYCEFGFKENRLPNAYFLPSWYLDQLKGIKPNNPLLHYINEGWKGGLNPSFKFDNSKYIADNASVKELNIEPLGHFLTQNNESTIEKYRVDYDDEDIKIILNSSLFCESWFNHQYSDLKNVDGLFHFCVHGHRENRKINPFFDTKWYKEKYSIESDQNPIAHYLMTGWKNGCNPSIEFDSQQYINAYLDIKENIVEPLGHFLSLGINKGYSKFEVEDCGLVIDRNKTFSERLFPDLHGLFEFKLNELDPPSNNYSPRRLDIHFVIPDFGVGGGGHMNIFRMIRLLELMGHKFTIWIFRPNQHSDADSAYKDILLHYNTLEAKVKFLDDSFGSASGDVIFATSWNTVWPVQNVSKFKRRFYFIQDYETLFNAKGARSELAEYTYTQDLDCICASKWLEGLMSNKFSKWARGFNLAADENTFYPTNNEKNNVPRIIFYSRIFTERRGVELGILALEMLANEGFDFHVDFYGADFSDVSAPFSCNIYSTRTPGQLAKMYNQADVGLVFSLTNYSLVPQEMMACGLAIVEFDTESTRAIYPDDVVSFAGPTPESIKDSIKKLLLKSDLRQSQAKTAMDWVKQFSWYKSAKVVEQSIIERLTELGFTADENLIFEDNIKVSVIIPTYNGGEIFKETLDKALKQKTPWKYEVIVLDSESSDGTLEYVNKIDNVRVETIRKNEFNHGGTRNYGASISKGEFVAFITQDAIPKDVDWLCNLVTTLEHFPNAAGVFGKHIAHNDASIFTKNETDGHFGSFDRYPIRVSNKIQKPDNIPEKSWGSILHFYSDNNSCLRKSVWEKIPYREVQYGEDQLWAHDIINAGYEKIYAPTAIVFHSHDYEPEDLYERSKIDGDYFKHFWGYNLVEKSEIDSLIKNSIVNIEIFSLENSISKKEVEKQIECIKSKYRGYLDGSLKEQSMFDIESTEKSKF